MWILKKTLTEEIARKDQYLYLFPLSLPDTPLLARPSPSQISYTITVVYFAMRLSQSGTDSQPGYFDSLKPTYINSSSGTISTNPWNTLSSSASLIFVSHFSFSLLPGSDLEIIIAPTLAGSGSLQFLCSTGDPTLQSFKWGKLVMNTI